MRVSRETNSTAKALLKRLRGRLMRPGVRKGRTYSIVNLTYGAKIMIDSLLSRD